MTKKRLNLIKTKVKSFCRDVMIASVYPDKDNDFIAIINISPSKRIPIARIYEYDSHWYIWWLRDNYRQSIENFTAALKFFELRVNRNWGSICVA